MGGHGRLRGSGGIADLAQGMPWARAAISLVIVLVVAEEILLPCGGEGALRAIDFGLTDRSDFEFVLHEGFR